MIGRLFELFNWIGSEWVLIILFALSVVAVGVILERSLELRKLRRASRMFWRDRADTWLSRADSQSWRNELEAIAIDYPCLETEALEIVYRTGNAADPEKVLEAFLERRKAQLERGIGILGTIGANAPFVGLLGTVLGIIRAFHTMSVKGAGNGLDTIGVGISEALVATAVGLLVAVPAVSFFNLLNKQIRTLLQRTQSIALLALSAHHGAPQERG